MRIRRKLLLSMHTSSISTKWSAEKTLDIIGAPPQPIAKEWRQCQLSRRACVFLAFPSFSNTASATRSWSSIILEGSLFRLVDLLWLLNYCLVWWSSCSYLWRIERWGPNWYAVLLLDVWRLFL